LKSHVFPRRLAEIPHSSHPSFLYKALLSSDALTNHAITGFRVRRLRGGQWLYVLAVVAPRCIRPAARVAQLRPLLRRLMCRQRRGRGGSCDVGAGARTLSSVGLPGRWNSTRKHRFLSCHLFLRSGTQPGTPLCLLHTAVCSLFAVSFPIVKPFAGNAHARGMVLLFSCPTCLLPHRHAARPRPPDGLLQAEGRVCKVILGRVVARRRRSCCGGRCGRCVLQVVASVFYARTANILDGITAGRQNNTRTAVEENAKASASTAFMFAYEAIMVPVLIISFSVVGVASARRVRHVLHAAATSAISMQGSAPPATVDTPRQLMRKIVNTCCVIFVSLLVRAVPAIFFAIAAGLQRFVSCDAYTNRNRCSECYDMYTHMFMWIVYTPSLIFAVALVSQPVALLVALWGMTSGQTLALMKANSAAHEEL
jgi:hypothetical protein